MAAAKGWEHAVLKAIGAPITPDGVRFLDLWQRAEGGGAAFNPLNTTQPGAGASDYNSVGVKNYPSFGTGIHATAQTLLNGRYAPIVEGLRGGASLVSLARAVAASPWGTGTGVLRLLGANPGPPAASSVPAAASRPDVAAAPLSVPSAVPAALAAVYAANNATIGLPAIDITSLLEGAAQPTGPSGPAALRPPASTHANQGQGGAIAELLREGTGGPTHSTGPHLHFASLTPQAMLAALAEGRRLGLTELENPYVDAVNFAVHAPNSYHKRTFPGTYNGRRLGEATDFSGDPSAVDQLYKFIQSHYSR